MRKVLLLLVLSGFLTSCYVHNYRFRKQARKNVILEYERRVQLDTIKTNKNEK
jgi:hypothetical protein